MQARLCTVASLLLRALSTVSSISCSEISKSSSMYPYTFKAACSSTVRVSTLRPAASLLDRPLFPAAKARARQLATLLHAYVFLVAESPLTLTDTSLAFSRVLGRVSSVRITVVTAGCHEGCWHCLVAKEWGGKNRYPKLAEISCQNPNRSSFIPQ